VLPLLHPQATTNLPTEHFESIRLVFTDLYLGAAEAMSDGQAQYMQVAGQLLALNLKDHSPYVLIVWTSHPEEVDALTKVAQPVDGALIWRLVQIEGNCDAVQNKPGVVPFALAIEVAADTQLKGKGEGLPQSIYVTPVFDFTDQSKKLVSKKLVFCLRFFFTIARQEAAEKAATYRLREAMINSIASSWATHLTRPGYVAA
jgi:hypothetical protein